MVTYGTCCPEGKYIDKDDDINLFRNLYHAPVWPLKALFDPLLWVPFNCGEIRQILSYVVQDANNCRKCLQMTYTDIIESALAHYDHVGARINSSYNLCRIYFRFYMCGTVATRRAKTVSALYGWIFPLDTYAWDEILNLGDRPRTWNFLKNVSKNNTLSADYPEKSGGSHARKYYMRDI